jgi:hypothetical protein
MRTWISSGGENHIGAVSQGEPPGRWYGAIAQALGLSALVDHQDKELVTIDMCGSVLAGRCTAAGTGAYAVEVLKYSASSHCAIACTTTASLGIEKGPMTEPTLRLSRPLGGASVDPTRW